MFLFIARFLKGLILGWIMALIFYLVKRALTRTFGNMPQQTENGAQQNHTQNTYNPSPTHDVVETIWAGMSVAKLKRTFGAPVRTQNVAGGEVWTYTNLNGHGTETAITIQNGVVLGWQDTPHPAPPSLSPTSLP